MTVSVFSCYRLWGNWCLCGHAFGNRFWQEDGGAGKYSVCHLPAVHFPANKYGCFITQRVSEDSWVVGPRLRVGLEEIMRYESITVAVELDQQLTGSKFCVG